MKQAILITAYKDIDAIGDIVEFFGPDFNIYIHIDRKTGLNTQSLVKYANVFISNQYRVVWGGLNHLKAILLLAEKALQNSENQFFHLVTAEDFPVKPLAYFKELDISKNYLEYFEMPAACWAQENGGFDRVDYYNLHDFLNAKKTGQHHLLRRLLHWQKTIGFKRSWPAELRQLKLYGGSTYWSLNRLLLQYIIDFTISHPKLLSRLRNTFCAEEIYIQTIALQSPFSGTLVNSNLRYVNWEKGAGGSPAYLGVADYEKLVTSDKIFARKIDMEKSKELRKMLSNFLTQD